MSDQANDPSKRGPIKPVAKPGSIPPAPKPGAARPVPPKPASSSAPKPPVKPTAAKDDKKSTVMSAAAKKTEKKEAAPKVEEKKEDKKKGNALKTILLPLLIVLFFGGNVVLYGLMSTQKADHSKEMKLQVDKYNALDLKYQDLLKKNEQYLQKLTGIQSEKDSVNTMVLDLIEKLKKNKISITRYRQELAKFKSQPSLSQSVIDSFEREHSKLNDMITKLSKSNEIKGLEISTLKEQLDDAKKPKWEELAASDIEVIGLYDKKGEDVISNKMKKIERLEIMFYIDENPVVKKGMKTLFFAFEDEDGNIIDDQGSVTLKRSGNSVGYTFSGHVDYPFKEVAKKEWFKPEGMKVKKGKYKLHIYNKDMEIGSKSVEFK